MSCIVAYIEWYHEMDNGTEKLIKGNGKTLVEEKPSSFWQQMRYHKTASSSGDPHVHIIKQVKATDEGLYTCIAVNAAVRQLSFDFCNLLFLLLLLHIAQNQLWIN